MLTIIILLTVIAGGVLSIPVIKLTRRITAINYGNAMKSTTINNITYYK